MGLEWGSDSYSNYLPSAVDVGTDGLVDFCADGCYSLGKFGRGKPGASLSLMVESLKLFELVGF